MRHRGEKVMAAARAAARAVKPASRGDAAGRPSERMLALAASSRRELDLTFLRGHTPDLDQLVGWEFRGVNTPRWARLAGIKKFVKGFERREAGPGGAAVVVGYNRPARQNRLEAPWQVGARRFGWYRVELVDPTARDNAHLHAVLLDYSRGDNRPLDPSRGLRDYLVQVDPDDPDLYLGVAHYALGGARLPVSYFVLERMRRAPEA